ncbi:hypothetical protein LTX96_0000488 [Nakaseomyces glabratus]|nr:hypothetical protein LTX96_0000488 [Nakaseomyces glabratus]
MVSLTLGDVHKTWSKIVCPVLCTEDLKAYDAFSMLPDVECGWDRDIEAYDKALKGL